MICEVCNLVEFKYKCPKCLAKYCSLDCFKQHKLVCQTTNVEREEVIKMVEAHTMNDGEIDEMEAIGNSIELKTMIRSDPLLEKYIKAINEAEDPYQLLDQLKDNPRFIEFRALVLQILKSSSDN